MASASNKANKKQFNILLFGETGSGKSTLINYLTNYFRSGSLQNLKIAIRKKYFEATEGWDNSEADVEDTTKSKTKECAEYGFEKDGFLFNFIDTPGLSDTAGTSHDDDHLVKIMAAAENSGTMAAIIIVINGTIARATVNLQNTLTRLKGSVPDVLLDNIVVVLTNCSRLKVNFDLKTLEPWRVAKENVFHMDNCALCIPKAEWEKDEDLVFDQQREWQKSMKTIVQMIERIQKFGCKATNAFKEMREKREKIKSELYDILQQVKTCQTLHNNLRSLQIAEKDAATGMEKSSNYIKHEKVEVIEMVDDDCDNAICPKHQRICEEDVVSEFSIWEPLKTLKTAYYAGRTMLFDCKACDCDWNTHIFAKKKPVKSTKTVEKVLENVKKQYEAYMNKKQEIQTELSSLSENMDLLKYAIDDKEAEIQKCCEQLKQLCSNFNFVKELTSVVEMLKADAETITNMQLKSDANDRIRRIGDLITKLSEKK